MNPKIAVAFVAVAIQAGCATSVTKPPEAASDLFIRSLMTAHSAEPQPASPEHTASRSEER
jgi:hypothetical protein